MEKRIQRREFIKRSLATTAAVSCGVWTSRSIADNSGSPNDKLDIGCIGVGGKGWVDMNGVASENIVAICDVDENALAKAAKQFPGARRFTDYRKLLEGTSLDAVTVSTPDHSHAPAAVQAMKLGKHVYCQKPLSRSIHEARTMRRVARETGVATQMGNQGHSNSGSRQMVEWVRAGAIGDVREVHVWTNRPIWPQGHTRPKGQRPVPPHLHWNLWLGPAPERPYHDGYHPFAWRGFWDFGTGALGDMGCHNMDAAFWALELDSPTSVEATSSGVNAQTAPKSSTVTYEFAARGARPPVRLTWYDGDRRPPAKLVHGETIGKNGSIWVGDRGTLFVPHFWGAGKLLPAERFVDFEGPEPTLPRWPGNESDHYREWIAACKDGPRALSNFDYSAGLTEVVLLGNLALRTGRKLAWNSDRMRAEGCPEADAYLRSEYRTGWTV